MDFQSRLLCWVKYLEEKKMEKDCWFVFFYGKYSWEKNVQMYLKYFSFVVFFSFFQGFRIFFDHFHNAHGLKLQIAFKVGCNLWSNQKKSLCENVVNRIFMFNHLILFKSKSKLSLFQQETPIVTKWISSLVTLDTCGTQAITWHKYKLYSIERLNFI